jgi:hypothetical protein
MPTDPHQLDARQIVDLVERLILEQQRLEPLELLLAAGVLAYRDYEAWQLGRRALLQDALQLPLADTLALLRQAAEQARAAGLVPEPTAYRRWGESAAALVPGPSADLRRALATVYAPPPARRQLDLFYDSSSAILEQTLREAVLGRRFAAAREAADKLHRHAPEHPRVGDWRRLINSLEQASHALGAEPCRADAAALLRDIDTITPVATSLLGPQARDCLALLWAALAQAAQGLTFDPAEPRLHASWALAQLGRWQEARCAIEAEPGWQAEPGLLEPYARACRGSGDPRAARAALLASCWSHPQTAERILAAGDCPDSLLAAHWTTFCDLDPGADAQAASAPMLATGDFPAWCLLADPALAAAAPADTAALDPHRTAAYRAARALASAPQDLDQRRRLGAAHPALLAAFLQLRRGER